MMTYYRMAFQNQQTNVWTWKTTVVSSLQAALQLLQSFRALPQDRIRVFTAASKKDLNEMLTSENTNLASGSVTAAQFLRERKLLVPGQAQSAAGKAILQETAVAISSSPREFNTSTGFSGSSDMSSLEKRRLEIECGPGGDHDTQYRFTLPIPMPQLLAWTRLQRRLQAGELQS